MIRPTIIREGEAEEKKDGSPLRYEKPPEKLRWGERLARNMALAGILMLTAVAMRNAALPTGQTVIAAVQEMIQADWDQSLGRISFVSSLLPETVAVFFEPEPQVSFSAPCFGEIVHAWRAEEPYLGYSAHGGPVYAIGKGQVMSVAHGLAEEMILRLRHEDGLESMYYNLASVQVREGDAVDTETCLGRALPDSEALVEVRRAGRAIDPTGLIAPRTEARP